jgi:hypothetical protein
MSTEEEKDPRAARLSKLEAHRKLERERQEKEQDESEGRELEAFELSDKLEATLGEPRKGFAIINNRAGVFAIRKPDTRAIRTWEHATDKQKLSAEWLIAYLRHYIEPKEKLQTWMALCAERPGLLWQTSDAFVELMFVDRGMLEKKG